MSLDRKNIELENTDGFFGIRYRKSSRADFVYDVVKERILRGYWVPGDKIDDAELALQLDVSRLTVREALSKFVESRIVERLHWKGYQVRRVSWEEIEGILDLRLAIEELAVRCSLARMTPAIADELESSIRQSWQDLENEDYVGFRKTDFDFHDILFRESGNVWISDIVNRLRLVIEVIRSISQSEDIAVAGHSSVEEHQRILERIQARDIEGAASRMKEHILNHRERVRVEYNYLLSKAITTNLKETKT